MLAMFAREFLLTERRANFPSSPLGRAAITSRASWSIIWRQSCRLAVSMPTGWSPRW